MSQQSTASSRIVVTGIGTITSLGTGIDAYWQNLIAGKSGIRKVTRFDASAYPCQVASEVQDFDPAAWMGFQDVKRNDRYTQFALAASKLAIKDAQLDLDQIDKTRLGVLIGSGIGGMETIETQSRTLFEKGPRKVSPYMIPSLISNIAAGTVAIDIGAQGPNFAVVSACSTSTHAIGESLRLLRYGDADIMLAGGSEAAITQLGFAGFCALRAMSTGFNDCPEKASRPFDAKRDGFIMGEGAGVLILERLEHALQRGARIYCELIGYAATCDAYHITAPDAEGVGLSLCFERVLKDAKIEASAVDYINAHGTSTNYNDKFETLAIKKVFKDHAHKVKISSTKSMTGHLLGAAGAIEAAACIKAIQTQLLPPTINLDNPDPDCDLDYIPHTSINANVQVAVTNNSGFGGHNAALAFAAFKN
jgi:3-oxoacyl-[acyl-carrier-protein] synthase II